MKIFFCIIFVFSMISCVGKPTSKNNNQFIETNNGDLLAGKIDYVILEYNINDNSTKYLFKNSTPAELTENDLNELSIITNNAVENYNNKNDPRRNIILSNYLRQYIAVINEKGEKEVFVNCFSSRRAEENDYWKTHFVFVLDGGKNYFQLKINLAKKIYYEFHVNGYA